VAAHGEGQQTHDQREAAVTKRDRVVSIRGETAYPASVASARVRIAAFGPHLSAHGVDLRYSPTLSDAEYGTINSDGDPARKALSLSRGAVRLTARQLGRRDDGPLLVHRLRFLTALPGLEPARHPDAYDFDDALYIGSILPQNRRFGWLKREAEHWLSYVSRARVVIAGNSHLAEHAREHARSVEVVPSCVDPERQLTHQHGEREVVTIGWIGSRTTVDQLRTVLPALAAINESRVRARIVLIGLEGLDFEAPWLEQRPWTLSSEPQDLASFDIGIMPMPATDWTRGKCGYKVLQYFAAGVPAVASPVGVNTTLVGAAEERGLLADTLEEWRAALERLVADSDARAAMGAAGREFVEREFSYQRWAPELAGLLADL
jgi:glycosyltransferase involved in cell wall biosynthesis